jgi:hypothetical protein
MRRIFVVLEQQRATRDAVENLGRPDEGRVKAKILKQRALEDEAKEAAEKALMEAEE